MLAASLESKIQWRRMFLEKGVVAHAQTPLRQHRMQLERSGTRRGREEGVGGGQQKIERSFTQSQLKILRGIEVPFNSEQADIVHEQFLRATISANLPFRWVEDCHYSCSSDPLQPMSCPHVTKFLAHFSTVRTTG